MSSEKVNKGNGEFRTFYYAGPSMRPTFRNGDLLKIDDRGQDPRPGDVIIFRKGSDRPVIHRIVSRETDGFLTRGDNNGQMDPWTVQPFEVIGRVSAKKRSTRWHPTVGGYPGVWLGRLFYLKNLVRNNSIRLLRPGYRFLGKWMARAIYRAGFIPEIYRFERPDGVELQWIFAGRLVGFRSPGADSWRIRPPFRLLFGEGPPPQRSPESAS